MVRKLKHHEQKLLRKVDFTTYASDNNHRDAAVIRRYAIQKPSDVQKYSRICGVRLLQYLILQYQDQQQLYYNHSINPA